MGPHPVRVLPCRSMGRRGKRTKREKRRKPTSIDIQRHHQATGEEQERRKDAVSIRPSDVHTWNAWAGRWRPTSPSNVYAVRWSFVDGGSLPTNHKEYSIVNGGKPNTAMGTVKKTIKKEEHETWKENDGGGK